MSDSTRQKLLRRKRRIQRRLRPRKFHARPKPLFTAGNIHYDIADRTRALGCGGIGAVHLLARKVGLIDLIDRQVQLLKTHLPYHESDHVLNIAYNVTCGGRCREDISCSATTRHIWMPLGPPAFPTRPPPGTFAEGSSRPIRWTT